MMRRVIGLARSLSSSSSRLQQSPRATVLCSSNDVSNTVDANVVKIEIGASRGGGGVGGVVYCPANEFRGLSTAEFGAIAGALNVRAASRVVIASAANVSPLLAARLWWMFESHGLSGGARVLEGGSWSESEVASPNQSLSSPAAHSVSPMAGASWSPKPVAGAVSTTADVLAAIASSGGVQIVDVRTPAEYAGLDIRGGATRGGHVPGARNVPWTDLVDAAMGREWLDNAQLAAVFERAGVDTKSPCIVICQAGIRATAGVLALRALGGNTTILPMNYVGAMAEWLNDRMLPVIHGMEPGGTGAGGGGLLSR